MPPEPEQLFRLAGVVAETAKSQAHLKPGRMYRNARFMHLEPVEVSYVGELDQQLQGFEHKLRGHIRRIAPTKEDPRKRWSFRLGETLWTTHTHASETQGVSAMYSFEWTERSTVMALRRVRHLPTTDPLQLDDMIDRFYVRDDAADMLAAEMSVQSVSTADCDLLETKLRQLSQASDELYRARS